MVTVAENKGISTLIVVDYDRGNPETYRGVVLRSKNKDLHRINTGDYYRDRESMDDYNRNHYPDSFGMACPSTIHYIDDMIMYQELTKPFLHKIFPELKEGEMPSYFKIRQRMEEVIEKRMMEEKLEQENTCKSTKGA